MAVKKIKGNKLYCLNTNHQLHQFFLHKCHGMVLPFLKLLVVATETEEREGITCKIKNKKKMNKFYSLSAKSIK